MSGRSSSPLKGRGAVNGPTGPSSSSQGRALSLVERFRIKAREKLEKEEASGKAQAGSRSFDRDDSDSDDDLPGELNLSELMAGAGKKTGARLSAAAGSSRYHRKSRSRSNSVASDSSSLASLEYPSFADSTTASQPAGSSTGLPSSTPSQRARRSTAKTGKYSFRPKLVKPREETLLRLETKHSAAVKVGLRSAEEIAAAGRGQRGSSPIKRQPSNGAEPELGQAWDTSSLVRARKRDRKLGLDTQGMSELDRLIERSMRAFEENEESAEDGRAGSSGLSQEDEKEKARALASIADSAPWEDSCEEGSSESDSESDADVGGISLATVKLPPASPKKAARRARFNLPEEGKEEGADAEMEDVSMSSLDKSYQAVEKAIMASVAEVKTSPAKRKGKRARADDDEGGDDHDDDADQLLRILKKDRKDLRAAQSRDRRDRSLAWRRGRFAIYRPPAPSVSSSHPIQALLFRTLAAGGEIGLYPGSLSDCPRLASHLSSGLLALYDVPDSAEETQDLEDAGQDLVRLARWLFELGVHASAPLGQAAITGLHHLLHSPGAGKEVQHDGVAKLLRSLIADELLATALPAALHRLGAKPALLTAAYGSDRPAHEPITRIHRLGAEGSPTPSRLASEARARCVERLFSMTTYLAAFVDAEVARRAVVAIAWLAADPSMLQSAPASDAALQALMGRAFDDRHAANLASADFGLDKVEEARDAALIVQALPSLTLCQRVVRSCAASLALLGPKAFESSSEDPKGADARSLVPLRKLLDALNSVDPSLNPLHTSSEAPASGGVEARAHGGTDYALLEARVDLLAIALADVPLQLCTWTDADQGQQPPQSTSHGPSSSKDEPGDIRSAPQPRTALRGLAARPAVRQALAQLESELKVAKCNGGTEASQFQSSPHLRFSSARLGMLEKLIEKLQDMNGRINERGGSKLERTRVKDKLMRLALKLHYLIEALVGSENVGGSPGARGGPMRSGGLGGASGKKQGRQSTLFESFATAQARAR